LAFPDVDKAKKKELETVRASLLAQKDCSAIAFVQAALHRQLSPGAQETGRSLERATHTLPRAGVPLHHRTHESPQSGCHFLVLCAERQIVASKSIKCSP